MQKTLKTLFLTLGLFLLPQAAGAFSVEVPAGVTYDNNCSESGLGTSEVTINCTDFSGVVIAYCSEYPSAENIKMQTNGSTQYSIPCGDQGVCGTAHGEEYCSSSEIDTSNLCSSGTASSITTLDTNTTGAAKFQWTCGSGNAQVSCAGLYTGDPTCLDGVCGTATQTLYTNFNPPTQSSPLCNIGTSTAIQGENCSGSWNWDCEDGGSVASCEADHQAAQVNLTVHDKSMSALQLPAPYQNPDWYCTSGCLTDFTTHSDRIQQHWTWNCSYDDDTDEGWINYPGPECNESAITAISDGTLSINDASLCSAGTASDPSGSDTSWSWDCTVLDTSIPCTTGTPGGGGGGGGGGGDNDCGTANGTTTATAPDSGLCGVGDTLTSPVTQVGDYWQWTCDGSTCSAYIGNGGGIIRGSNSTPAGTAKCGPATSSVLSLSSSVPTPSVSSSQPSSSLCAVGTASTVTGSGPWSWICTADDGSSVACSTSWDGASLCGNGTEESYTERPTENLCRIGTPSTVIGNGPWTWTCSIGWVSSQCFARKDFNQLALLGQARSESIQSSQFLSYEEFEKAYGSFQVNEYSQTINSRLSALTTDANKTTTDANLTISPGNITPELISHSAQLLADNTVYYLHGADLIIGDGTTTGSYTNPVNFNFSKPTTFIIDGGDLIIRNNISTSGKSVGFFVLNNGCSSDTCGQIYIDPAVTDIVADLYAEGSILSAYTTSSGSIPESSIIDGFNEHIHDILKNQLYIKGKLISRNTVYGSLVAETETPELPQFVSRFSNYLRFPDELAYSSFYNASLQDQINTARRFDLSFLRRFHLADDETSYADGLFSQNIITLKKDGYIGLDIYKKRLIIHFVSHQSSEAPPGFE